MSKLECNLWSWLALAGIFSMFAIAMWTLHPLAIAVGQFGLVGLVLLRFEAVLREVRELKAMRAEDEKANKQ